MKIILKRYRKKTDTIDSWLYIEGMRFCDCAENAKSAIKTGQYLVSICKCKQHARKMPVIMLTADQDFNVSKLRSATSVTLGHETKEKQCNDCQRLDGVNQNTPLPLHCPMIKPGNGVYHRKDGSIIVGRYLAPGCLAHPKDVFGNIYERLRKSAERGHKITLTIEEHNFKPF